MTLDLPIFDLLQNLSFFDHFGSRSVMDKYVQNEQWIMDYSGYTITAEIERIIPKLNQFNIRQNDRWDLAINEFFTIIRN